MSAVLGVLGLSLIVLGVGCIDGGYAGVPVNDNWLGFFWFYLYRFIVNGRLYINSRRRLVNWAHLYSQNKLNVQKRLNGS